MLTEEVDAAENTFLSYAIYQEIRASNKIPRRLLSSVQQRCVRLFQHQGRAIFLLYARGENIIQREKHAVNHLLLLYQSLLLLLVVFL